MWDLIVSVPDHCLSFYFPKPNGPGRKLVIGKIYIFQGSVSDWSRQDVSKLVFWSFEISDNILRNQK